MVKTVFFHKLNSLIPANQSVRQFCMQHKIPEQRFADWKKGAQVSQRWLEKLSRIFDKPVDWFLKQAQDLRPSTYGQSFGMMTRYLLKATQQTNQEESRLSPDEVDDAVLDAMKRIHEMALKLGTLGDGLQPRGLTQETVPWAVRGHCNVIEEFLADDEWSEQWSELQWLDTVLKRVAAGLEGKAFSRSIGEIVATRTMPLYLSTVAASPLGRRIEEHDYDTIQVLQSSLEARQASTAEGSLVALKLAPEARSMEPYLMPGDIVVIDTTKGRDIETFEEGAIYAVKTNKQQDEVALKRIYKTDDTLLLCSDNRDTRLYPNLEAPVADLAELVIGRYLLIAERPDSIVLPLEKSPSSPHPGLSKTAAIDPDTLPWTHPLRRLWNLRRSREKLAGFVKRAEISRAELEAWYHDPDLDLGSRRMEAILDTLKIRGQAKRQWARCGEGPPPKPAAKKKQGKP